MVWWMLPIDEHISWEGHIAGAASGLLLALAFRKQGPLPDLELPEPEPDEKLPEWWAAAHPEHPDVVKQRERQVQEGTTTTDADAPRVQFRLVKKDESKSAPDRSAFE
jgi:hypothetical protein